jgi:hypothetical protein
MPPTAPHGWRSEIHAPLSLMHVTVGQHAAGPAAVAGRRPCAGAGSCCADARAGSCRQLAGELHAARRGIGGAHRGGQRRRARRDRARGRGAGCRPAGAGCARCRLSAPAGAGHDVGAARPSHHAARCWWCARARTSPTGACCWRWTFSPWSAQVVKVARRVAPHARPVLLSCLPGAVRGQAALCRRRQRHHRPLPPAVAPVQAVQRVHALAAAAGPQARRLGRLRRRGRRIAAHRRAGAGTRLRPGGGGQARPARPPRTCCWAASPSMCWPKDRSTCWCRPRRRPDRRPLWWPRSGPRRRAAERRRQVAPACRRRNSGSAPAPASSVR